MLDKPAHKTVIIRLLPGISLLILFAQLDQLAGLFHSKALVQEGIDEQIDKLLHVCNPPLNSQSGELPTLLPTLLQGYLSSETTQCEACSCCEKRRNRRTWVSTSMECCRSDHTPLYHNSSLLLPTIHSIVGSS